MPAIGYIDKIDDLSAQEKNGALVRLERVIHIDGVEILDSSGNPSKAFSNLIASLDTSGVFDPDLLADVPIPKFGDLLSGDDNVVLTERTFIMTDSDQVKVNLVYESFFEMQNFDFTGISLSETCPPSRIVYGECRASLQQTATTKKPATFSSDYPDDDPTTDRIAVQHTYPNDDKDASYQGITVKSGGELQVDAPQRTITFSGYKPTETPGAVVTAVLGKVNAEEWQLFAARTWKCTAANYKLMRKGYYTREPVAYVNPTYYFTFEFQYNPDTWDPTAVFIDDRSGQPPDKLVVDVGYKTYHYAEGIDFDTALGFPPSTLQMA